MKFQMRNLVFLSLIFLGGGCSPNLDAYDASIRSGRKMIESARQIEEVFGRESVDHFITYGGPTKTWNSQVYFYGRYRLCMQVDVVLSEDGRTVNSIVGSPMFYLVGVDRIKIDRDIIETTYASDNKFGLPDWEKVYKAHGDFSAMGLELIKNQPVPHFSKYEQGWRKDIRRPNIDEPANK